MLPWFGTRMFGRDRDIAAIRTMLATGDRVVTLVGPPGVGKTRLAHAIAERTAGAVFVALDAEPRALAEVARVAELRPSLLVLDGCDAARPAIAALVDAVAVPVLATSRAPLGARERVHVVPPLPADAALALLRDRAELAGHRLAAADDAVLAAIVERLDRLPLAIELAAARIGMLGPAAVAAGLEDGLARLCDDSVDRPARHRSVHAAIEYSWRLLDEVQRTAWAQLSVFRAAFTLDGARAVLDVRDTRDVETIVDELVAQSLVSAVDGRFTMLELLRCFARSMLAEPLAIERRHTAHVLETAASVPIAARGRWIELARDDLCAVLERGGDGAIDAAVALAEHDLAIGAWHAGVERFDRMGERSRADARVCAMRAALLERLGAYAEAAAATERGLALVRARERSLESARVELQLLATAIAIRVRSGDPAGATALAATAERLASQLDDLAARALADHGRALALHACGSHEAALAALREPRPLVGEPGLRGSILHALGRLDDAARELDPACSVPGDRPRVLLARAMVMLERGDRDAIGQLEHAAQQANDSRTKAIAHLVAAVAAVLDGTAVPPPADDAAQRDPELDALRALVTLATAARHRATAVLGSLVDTPIVAHVRRLIASRAGDPQPPVGPWLYVSADGARLELADGVAIDLTERRPLRLLMGALIRRHLLAPGEPLTVHDLAAAGWPGERVDERAAKNRVHVALAELRRRGLRAWVQRSPRGYFLDPALSVLTRTAYDS